LMRPSLLRISCRGRNGGRGEAAAVALRRSIRSWQNAADHVTCSDGVFDLHQLEVQPEVGYTKFELANDSSAYLAQSSPVSHLARQLHRRRCLSPIPLNFMNQDIEQIMSKQPKSHYRSQDHMSTAKQPLDINQSSYLDP
jgi:hypothetical protein